MADFVELVRDAKEDLKNQSKAVREAKEDVDHKAEARQKAKGKQVAIKMASWQDAVKQRDAERDKEKAIEARLQTLVEKLPSAGNKRLPAEEACGPIRSVRRKGMRTFTSGEAVDPEVHYYASTGTERNLQTILDNMEYALLIDHRQSGKSTAALASARNDSDTLYVYLRPLLDHESLWEYLHGELNAADPERFPRPSDPNARTFETSFTSLSGKVSIILDEANNLESIEAGTLDAFLNILRKLRHCRSNTSSGLGALVMVGTEDLLSTLKKNNQSSPLDHAVWTSPEKIKPKALTRMLQDWIDDCHNQTALASGVDAYARKIYEVCRGCAGPNSACCQILASRVEEYAEKIYEVCHGHAGLTGACCQRLKMEAEAALNKQEQYSLTKFDDFLTWSMPAILSGIPVYSRLLEEIKTKPSFAQLADLSQVIFNGSIVFDSESEDHRQLLNRGIVTIEADQDEGGQEHHRLIIAAPLLASAMLRKHRKPLPPSSVETLTVGQAKDAWQLGRWIIRQVTKHLDYAAATKPEGCIVKEMDGTPPPSGHTLQAQFAMIANSLYGHVEGLTDRDLASPSQVTRTTYKLVWEARSGRAKNHLDLLIRNGHSVRLGFELWIGRELEVLAERVKRAHQYAVQHDCRVWVVNFCLNDCEQPKKQLSLPKILFESKVQIADVQVCLAVSKAFIRYSRCPDQAAEEVLLAKGFDLRSLSGLWA